MLGAPGRLRPPAVLLLRPVRRRHGVHGLRPDWDRVVFRGDPADPRVHRLLADRRSRRGGHERQRLGRHRPDPAPHPRRASRSTTGASPTRRAARGTRARRRTGARHEPPAAAARRRRLDLARHALPRAARQRRLRGADRRLRGDRGDLQPHHLRQGDHRLRRLRRPASQRRRVRGPRPAGALLRARARRRPPRRRPAAPRLRRQRRARRLRLLRMHARPGRRHRGDRRAGARAVGAASRGPT